MAHEDAGHYAAKHPDAEIQPQIAELVKQYAKDGKISCAEAHSIAQQLHVSPSEVGVTIDLLEIKICRCQLGLFGYHPQRRIVQAAQQVAPDVRQAIEAAMVDGKLACLASWEIAERFGISRLEISSACEALQVKISPCQLGTF